MLDVSPPAAHGRFATTRWTLVLAASDGSSGQAHEGALDALCQIYWPAVYAFVRRQGHDADEARDLTQEFFARVLEKNYFSQADPDRGRFRTFLLACVRHFLSNERDHRLALKRGGGTAVLSLDAESEERAFQIQARDDQTPERLFDARWVAVLLERALSRVRDDYRAGDRGALFEGLKSHLTADDDAVDHAQAARTLGISEAAVRVAVHRLRRRFREALLAEIADTVTDANTIDDEVRYLLRSVSA
jgi:RNA polymerase sigma-70 factor (ECF subfamily)